MRPAVPGDAAELFRFMGDPAVMRFTHVQPDLDACRAHIAAHESRRPSVGCAPWSIIEKASGAIIGWGGLYDDPFEPGWGIEVAYLFAQSAWGRGYATELVARCVDIARDELRLASLTAFAHPENTASRRVLQKTGFAPERFVPEMQRFLYRHPLAAAQSCPAPA